MLTSIDIHILIRLDQMIFLSTNHPNRKALIGTVLICGVFENAAILLLFFCSLPPQSR
ncbi:hypothetical protein CTAM01_13731 [Colletotrichum tamarilloi]|uniref:Uncharacterized protein n=1 Tax=Colletotrichum tamarilloi TaxID=1209934 RepID=A0ABQ9QR89_9PEZI|nr:uncharacterized protein CTAM01_13731 [Colletotrichum tamarilloi]KAK1482091.1 hypothetical protein CTAM01_13731 [Colletotrichum tamarilloi]